MKEDRHVVPRVCVHIHTDQGNALAEYQYGTQSILPEGLSKYAQLNASPPHYQNAQSAVPLSCLDEYTCQ